MKGRSDCLGLFHKGIVAVQEGELNVMVRVTFETGTCRMADMKEPAPQSTQWTSAMIDDRESILRRRRYTLRYGIERVAYNKSH